MAQELSALIVHRTLVQSPAPTWILMALHNFSSRMHMITDISLSKTPIHT